ncbi:hypothetical protein B0H13DRAFT_2500521 [Mycena leptocephala]|nr:hypothetical protein B0H13DRAFT_2500521 [Mycena leptocephala]
MATPTPGAGLAELHIGPASNRFARELAACADSVSTLAEYILHDFGPRETTMTTTRCPAARRARAWAIYLMQNLLFEFPWNNSVHDFIHQILTGNDGGLRRKIVVALFPKPTSVRLGFMGHLTLIAEDVFTALERFPAELRGDRGQPAWDEYVAGWHRETNRHDAGLLSGGNPVSSVFLRALLRREGLGSLVKHLDIDRILPCAYFNLLENETKWISDLYPNLALLGFSPPF